MKIYIVGPISQISSVEAIAKFEQARADLITAGIDNKDIINPLDFGFPLDAPFEGAVREKCMSEVQKSTAIYVLRGWRESIGSRHEITEAMRLKKDIYWEESNEIAQIENLASLGII